MSEQLNKPIPNFAQLLKQHKRPKFMLFTQQSNIDELIQIYIIETEKEREKNNVRTAG